MWKLLEGALDERVWKGRGERSRRSVGFRHGFLSGLESVSPNASVFVLTQGGHFF